MLYPREIAKKIKKMLFREEFVIISGARQSGKTSLLLLLKDFLEGKGEQCSYVNLENLEHLKLLNRRPRNIFELIPESARKQYIFVDEIQYLENPTNFLKLLYDEERRKIKIIASGSSSFYIDKKFRDSLAGRKFLFELHTLNFNEFLVFSGQKELLERKKKKITLFYKEKLFNLWEKYLIFGGYPKVALAKSDEMRRILLEEIGTSYVKKDISDAGIRNAEKYFSLLRVLATQTGQLVNSQELAKTLGIIHKTVEEYLYVMEKSYQAAFISPFHRNIRKELTKMPKVYFYDLGLRNFFLGNFSVIKKREDKGSYLENIVFCELLKEKGNADDIKFWRTQDKKEIDFIVGKEALEIKFNADKKMKLGKYERFKQRYPEIALKFLGYGDVLKKFYGWKV